MHKASFLIVASLLFLVPVIAQSPNATINGIALDSSGAAIAGAEIIAVNDVTGIQYSSKTNSEGIYVVTNLPPGPYRLQISKVGFKTLIKPDIILNVQDALAINFTLPIGAVSEVVTVTGGAPLINTTDASVSTVVDRQFAENLPMNGRSFQTLIQLAPGVVVTPSTLTNGGQFSVNGQRASANYWMLDGVSANVGVNTSSVVGNGLGGSLGSFSVLGGTNSLVSVDAMQEFRIQTSTYAPEFGRTPGAQIAIVTRSGTKQFHGTAFDYLRNDVFDADNWFNTSVTPPLPKAKERQNDFGGTFSGPISHERTFFFFSYEGLRLRLPQTTLTTVPDLAARQSAIPAMQPYLNTLPLPNGPDNTATGMAQFNASYSNPATLDAYSLRIDHKLSHKLTMFGRYSYSPSELTQRGQTSAPLSDVTVSRITTQTFTAGAAWTISPVMLNDLRFNYSRTLGSSFSFLDGFGGAAPLAVSPFPSSFTAQNALFFFDILPLSGSNLFLGKTTQNLQQQINVVDNLSAQKGSHGLKFGVDFRRLSPMSGPRLYDQEAFFASVGAAEAGNLAFSETASHANTTLLFHNLGVFAQDTWRIIPRFTMTYGLRWDVDFAPSTASGASIPAVTGFNLDNPSTLALAPSGSPVFHTRYANLAPRLGLAYQLFQKQDWQTVLRGGLGLFYDLATSEVGDVINGGYPFLATNLSFGGTFPLTAAAAAPPPITAAALSSGTFYALDPNIKLPYSLQWNVALEQALGRQQTLSFSYVGSRGRRLLAMEQATKPNPNFGTAVLVGNVSTSDYNALQMQLQRPLSHGLQALASYTWSHSIDDGSAGFFSTGNLSDIFFPSSNPRSNRGNSSFDIRNALSAALTYDVPTPRLNAFAKEILRSWSLENVVQARSAPPVDLFYSKFEFLSNGALADVRPDLVAGQALYLYGPQYPGGKALNAAAFTPPPLDPATHLPIREGNLGRNSLRGFGATQWDFAAHRDLPIHESLKLQFRAEFFNVLNHPNFGPPVSNLTNTAQFGQSTQLLAQSLGSASLGNGGFNPLYQIGGPRSVQLALKLLF
jgi:Carboxypeptidase regulatory-like domain